MKELLDFVIKSITGTDDFEIIEEENVEGFVKFTVSLPKEQVGLVIGKEGKTIKAIRSLLRARATLDKKGFTLDVQEKADKSSEK